MLSGLVFSHMHPCHFSGDKAVKTLFPTMSVHGFRSSSWKLLHAHTGFYQVVQGMAFWREVSIDKLIKISSVVPLESLRLVLHAGHETCFARPPLDNMVPPVISSNPRIKKKSSGECCKRCRSAHGDLPCWSVMNADMEACSRLFLHAALLASARAGRASSVPAPRSPCLAAWHMSYRWDQQHAKSICQAEHCSAGAENSARSPACAAVLPALVAVRSCTLARGIASPPESQHCSKVLSSSSASTQANTSL